MGAKVLLPLTVATLALLCGAPAMATGSAATTSAAAPTVKAPTTVAPGAKMTVGGTGFGTAEVVDVYLGTQELSSATTRSGSFQRKVTVPALTSTGPNWITAVGRQSGLAATRGVGVYTSWLQLGNGPQRDDANPTEQELSPTTVPGLQQSWVLDGSFESYAVVRAGVSYVGSESGTVYAVDETTGAVRWTYATGAAVVSSPAISGSLVIVGSTDGNLYALNAATGTPAWTFSTGSEIVSAPTVSGSMVYVGALDPTLYALVAATGALTWSHPTAGAVRSSPAVSGGGVYLAAGGTLTALDAATGSSRWSIPQIADGSGPIVSGGSVYVLTTSGVGNVEAVDTSDGVAEWAFAGPVPMQSVVAVADHQVYATTMSGYVIVLADLNGAFEWSGYLGGLVSMPAIANGVLYVGSTSGRVFALAETTGASLWSAIGNGAVWSVVVTDGQLTVVCTGAVQHYSLHAAT